MGARLRKGTRVNRRMMQRLQDADLLADLRVNGFRMSKTRGGTALAPLPALPKYVFIIRLVGDVAVCKPAVRTPVGWRIPTDDNHYIRALLAPNHTAGHYEFHVLTQDQPCEKALACTLERDHEGNVIVVPGLRFKLVEAPDPSECAECT